MSSKYTFWKLTSEKTIEIPIIQRDYAQGRISAKETEIRKRFLDTLYKSIEDRESNVNLDFVYGKIENKKLIPLDGQQRLTTLFLLHWYLAMKESRLENHKEVLSNFTYETRVSSREFCNALVYNIIEFKNEIIISKAIENQNWFFQSWKKDPTIQSMLTMIDAIHSKFKDTDGLFEKLICDVKPPITFDFLPLNEFKLTDELYVKMNARGKPLTDFEDFKAKFVELLSNEDASKLDNSWTDLFWKHRRKDKKDGYFYIDEIFLNFFTNLTVNFAIINNNIGTKKKLDKVNIMEIYQVVYKNPVALQNIIKILDKLVEENKANKLDKDNFDYFIEKTDLSYWDRAKFFAFSKFLFFSDNKKIKHELFNYWFKVTSNIIFNYNIDSVDKFKNVLNLINQLSEHIENLDEYIASDNFIVDKAQSFKTLEFQKYEEHIKAKLIRQSKEWKQAIENAEKHEYLNGHISFLIEMAENDLNIFQRYYERFNHIFIENDSTFLFQRALLVKGDYLVRQGLNYSFCSFDKSPRGKDDNWKVVFHDEESQRYLKELLNDNKSLNVIIEESNINDWREGFIKEPLILNYCKRLQIRFENENDILLLSKERTSGLHAEYYTYCLYFELKKLFSDISIEYKFQNSIELDKYISLDNDTIKITFSYYDDNIWQYKKASDSGFEYYDDKNELIKTLNDLI